MKKILLLLVILGIAIAFALPRLDSYQREGTLGISSLQSEVRVLRDASGVPYIYADTLDDALTAQGFIHAQDRIFQMELFRYLSHGRLAEFIGERGLKNDRIIRLVDITGFARRQVLRIGDKERNYLQRYLNGINDFIVGRQDEHPLMLSVMGHKLTPWTLEDILAAQYFSIWSSSVNWKQELRAVGVSKPNGPGLALGRTADIAWGATNGYSDMVDLFIESVDPDKPGNYLEGEKSIPFTTRTEEVRISDREAEGGYRIETMEIRETGRGSVISDHGMNVVDGKVLSLRWSIPEYVGSDAGNRELLIARSVDEALVAIAV